MLQLLDLPQEIIDLVIDHLFTCAQHPWASRSCSCIAWHGAAGVGELTPVRLTSRLFERGLAPPLFHHVALRGPHRHEHLLSLSRAPHLAEHVAVMRLDKAPRDLGRPWLADIHRFPAELRARYYFDDLAASMAPALRAFPNLEVLHLSTTYDGLQLAGTSRGELLMPAFEALCAIIRRAGLACLEEVQVGIPYEGGYAGFFQDTGHKLGAVSPNLRSASVKLRDWQDNFTVMPIKV